MNKIHIPPQPGDRLLVLEEAALLARVSIFTIRRWIAAGLPSCRAGRVRVRQSDLMDYMERPHSFGPSAAKE